MEIRSWRDGDAKIPHGTTGIFQMSAADYHSDPCEKPSLSASIAKRLVCESPFHARLHHPRLGGCSGESNKAMDRGTLIHSMILGHDPSDFAVIQCDDWRTKAAKSARDSARAEGRTPVKESDYRDAECIADEVHQDLLNLGVVLSGMSEIVLLWVEDVDGVKVQCRAMQDHLIAEVGQIIDIKTCDSAHPAAVQRTIYNFGYDIQQAAYVSAYEHVFPDMAGRAEFIWCFIELLPDDSHKKSVIQLYRPDGMMRELGSSRWQRALKKWASCTANNHWPLYADGIGTIAPQGWVVKENLGERQE